MNFLITGGAGSVGRDVTASLLREGHRVRVLDKQAETVSPFQDKKPEWIQGRLEDARLVEDALHGVDGVIHLATVYLEWKEFARMIIEVTGSTSSLKVVPAREWKGAPFLADSWELSTSKSEHLFDYRSLFSPSTARQRLKKAVERCLMEIQTDLAKK
jgi:NAD(P)-dependent dehydrogenase (short-subunit alcohol dehydrogenase family)